MLNEEDACGLIKIVPVDGWFWVEKDGKVIDPWFKEERIILDTFKCTDTKYYREASELVQKVYVGMLMKGYKDLMQITTEEEVNDFIKKWKFEWNKQCLNVYVLWRRIGGTIKFGSMGYKKKNSKGIHWEYGHESNMNVKDYKYPNII